MLSISFNSKFAYPGVSAINVFLLISYNFTEVVVFLPFLFFLLISPSNVILSSKIAFIVVDFPTPELPEKAVILPSNTFSTSSIPNFSLLLVGIII